MTPVEKACGIFETPFYLYDKTILDRQVDKLHKNKPVNLHIFYAMKGNSSLKMLQYFKNKGIGTEIASGGELFLAKTTGFLPEQIIFTGPGKTDLELQDALDYGIHTIHIESLNEAKRLHKICGQIEKKQKVLVRINANFEVKTKIQLSGIPGPFGISEESIPEILPEILQLENLEFKGVHVYNASGILDHRMLLRNVENVFEMVKKLELRFGIDIPIIDFGGGLGIDYGDDDRHINIQAYYTGLHQLIKQYRFGNKQLFLEIARYLVAESGFYITKILDKKTVRGKTFLITDGGIHHFMRTALFGENHSTEIIQQFKNEQKEMVTITGCLCTSIDVLVSDMLLSVANPGDFVVIKKAGCYSLNGGINHFLGHEMPAEIWHDNGDFLTIRNRSVHRDLLLNQINYD